mgnify:CR=1 FL=1
MGSDDVHSSIKSLHLNSEYVPQQCTSIPALKISRSWKCHELTSTMCKFEAPITASPNICTEDGADTKIHEWPPHTEQGVDDIEVKAINKAQKNPRFTLAHAKQSR